LISFGLRFTDDAEPVRPKGDDDEAREESAVRTSGLTGRLATGRSKGDWQAGHCNTPCTSTALDSSFSFSFSFPFPFPFPFPVFFFFFFFLEVVIFPCVFLF